MDGLMSNLVLLGVAYVIGVLVYIFKNWAEDNVR